MRKYCILLVAFFNSVLACSQDFKVVGYLPSYSFEIIDNIDFTKITHLNLAFLNPDIDGNLTIGGVEIDPIIAHAKTYNPELKVFISIGGGGRTEELINAYDKFLLPENRSEFSHLLVEYVSQHHLDGIDVDLEWDMFNKYYSPFVLDLADSLKSHGKQISAALPATFRYADLSQEALDAYDFINLMVYDKTGPWRPNDPGPHSPREFANQAIAYWRNQGLEDEKMILGVPFYGYDFTDQNNVTAFTYGSLVSENEHYAYSGQIGERYYNGIPTIQHKTLLAISEQISGIMIWELGQDSFINDHEFSLLSAIDFVVENGTIPVTGTNDLTKTRGKIYPNPFHEKLTVFSIEGTDVVHVRLFDMQGKEFQYHSKSVTGNEHSFDFSQLRNGIYILAYSSKGKKFKEKVIRMD